MLKRSISMFAAVVFPFAVATAANSQDSYPERHIRIVSPHQSGSTTEFFGRLLTTEMGEVLGQTVIIEPRPGAAGTIGAREVSKSEPDGYTALMNASIQVMYPGMFKDLPFNVDEDFMPVGIFGFAPVVVVTSKESGIESFSDLIKRAEEAPGELSFASGGLGSLPHLAGELVNQETGVSISHIPYNGTGQALTDVLGGHVDIAYASIASAQSLIGDGMLKPLAVTSADRIEALPDVPTIAESGVEGFDVTSWYALWVPAETPQEIVDKLNETMRMVSDLPAVQKRMKTNSVIPSRLTAQEFQEFAREEGEKWLHVMKEAGLEPQ